MQPSGAATARSRSRKLVGVDRSPPKISAPGTPRPPPGPRPSLMDRINATKPDKGAPFAFGVGPSHSRIANFDQWFNQLHYDPKQPTAAQRAEIRAKEQAAIASSRRRMSQGSEQRRLLQLSSALRADLEIFVNHLLEGGTPHALPQTASPDMDSDEEGARGSSPDPSGIPDAVLTREGYLQLKGLFDILDVDRSGTLTFDELYRASIILGRDKYDVASFRKLDKNRSGSIDFVEMLKCFFPHMAMRSIVRAHKEYAKYAEAMKCVRDRLAPEHVAEMDAEYDRLQQMPGGCTVANLVSLMSPHMRRNRHITEQVFATFDADGDGALTRDEFCEMTKFSYPPYAKGPGDDAAAKHGFSLTYLARLRQTDPSKIRLPRIGTYHTMRPHVLHPAMHGTTEQRNERVYSRLVRLLGKEAVEAREATAAATIDRRRARSRQR